MKVFFYLLLTCISLELILRFAGFALLIPSEGQNKIRAEDSKKLRILAIGESTTADFFSDKDGGAWPRRLEKELLNSGIDARVYNEGLSGTITPMIVFRIAQHIDKYKPNIIISMMGINDPWNIKYDMNVWNRFVLLTSQIRIFKLIAWLNTLIESKLKNHIDTKTTDIPNFNSLVEEGILLAMKLPLWKVETALRNKISDEHSLAQVLTHIGIKLRKDFSSKYDTADARAYFDRAFDMFPYQHDIAFFELNGLVNYSRCQHVSKILLKCGMNLPDDILSEIATCMTLNKDLKSISALNSRNLLIENDRQVPTAYHYRIFNEILRKNGVFHIAMQYPTLRIEELKSYFTNKNGQLEDSFSDIIFISNRENFLNALKFHKYEELFADRFRGSWGHTTQKGHQLIAESAFKAVQHLIRTKLKARYN